MERSIKTLATYVPEPVQRTHSVSRISVTGNSCQVKRIKDVISLEGSNRTEHMCKWQPTYLQRECEDHAHNERPADGARERVVGQLLNDDLADIVAVHEIPQNAETLQCQNCSPT